MKKTIPLFKFLFIILDFLLFFLSLILVLIFRFGFDFFPKFQEHFYPFFFLFPFYLLILLSFDFYDFYILNLKSLFFRLLNFFLVSFIVSSLYFYFGQLIFSISPKTNLFFFLVIFSLFLVLSRLAFFKITFRKKIPVYFLGEENLKEKLKKDLANHPFFVFQESSLTSIEPQSFLVVSPSYHFDPSNLPFFLLKKITVFDFSDFYERFFNRIPLETINFDWAIKEIFTGETKAYFYLKRSIDLILSLVFLVFLFLPLFLPIAILIYLNSPGPIFFFNERVGYEGKIFKLIKFRTMKGESDKQKWASYEEKRIFFFGKILRKTHLDELPQIFNILKGELSFVGPRPEQPAIAKELERKIPFYQLRTLTLPGLTGWAQVNYKYPENIEETKIKLEYDLYYLKNSSLFLDILVIIKTFQKFLTL